MSKSNPLFSVRSLACALALLPASAALAEDAALVLGIERYERLGRVSGADNVVPASEALEEFGFAVTAVPNARAGNAISALDAWLAASEDADRLIAVLTGRFVSDGDRVWLLTAETEDVSLFGLGDRAISVDSVLKVLAERPGQSLLLLGGYFGETDEVSRFLRQGIEDLEIPGGVTVMTARPEVIANFVGDALTVPGGDLIELADEYRRLELRGFVPRSLVLMPDKQPREERAPAPEPEGPSAAETALWEGAAALDTVAAYRNYLDRYPRGAYRERAGAAIEAILDEPNRAARLAEEAIGLGRPARRAVQQDLTLLGYNTRGVDGIFGPGTRSAITNWQQQNGFSQTSYLTPEQIARLDAQAERREAEIAAEEERRRAEAERLDRAYWDETGARGDLPGLRAYLERYPEGLYSEAARERVAALNASAAQAADETAWQRARTTDTAAAYRAYLEGQPDGAYRENAQQRLAALTRPSQAEQAAAAAEEALGLNALTMRLIESRLAQSGYEPGQADGAFDDATRRAIARYQRDNGMNATGFLDQGVLVRLLADTFEALR